MPTTPREIEHVKEAMHEIRLDMSRIDKAALRANTVANNAIASIEAHERVCDLRYKNIDEKLTAVLEPVKGLQAALRGLTVQANQAIGMWKATLGVSAVVGLIFTVVKLAGVL